MVEITDNAYAVTAQIVQEQREEVKAAKEWMNSVKTEPAENRYRQQAEILEAMERLMRNLGLDC